MTKSIKQCEYCNGTGVITILLNTGCVYDGWEEPIYDDIPCEECGCTGLNMEEQAELNFNSVLEDNKKLRARLAEVEAQRDKLQDENEKLRGLMSIEADKHNERQILLQNTMEQLEELKVSLP